MKPFHERLGVCSWSLLADDSENLVELLLQTGLSRLQIDLDAIRCFPEKWNSLRSHCEKKDVHILSGMFRCVGEDYSTLESIRRTGGLLPDETWQDTWETAQAAADIAFEMSLKLVSFHAGFIPEDESDPSFEKLLHRMRLLADYFASKNIDLALETGQETAKCLKHFLEKLGRINVGVNFDPANMLMYGTGNPVEAISILGPFITQCHIKDGTLPCETGTFGEEVVVGQGQVSWPAFFQSLGEQHFSGFLFVERETGKSRVGDIHQAKQVIEDVVGV